MRARDRLREAPAGAGVGRRDGLDHLIEGDEIGRAAAERGRQQHAEQTRVVQRRENFGRDAPILLDAVAGGLDHGRERACARNPIDRSVPRSVLSEHQFRSPQSPAFPL